jgi:hypothetical protein
METKLKPNFKNLEKKNISDENKKDESPFDKFDREIINLFGNSKLAEYRWPILFSAVILILFLFVKIFLENPTPAKTVSPSVIVQLGSPVAPVAPVAPVVPIASVASVASTPAPNTIYAPILPTGSDLPSIKLPSANAIPLDLTKVTEPMSPIKITNLKKIGGFENFFNDIEPSLFTEFDTEM